MSSDNRLSTLMRNAMGDAFIAQIGANCLIDVYSGAKPAGPDVAITSQVKLAELVGGSTFAPATSGGVVTGNTIADGTGTAGAAGGTVATWFRISTSAGVAKWDGTVGLTGCDMNINNTNIATGQTVHVNSLAVTMPNA